MQRPKSVFRDIQRSSDRVVILSHSCNRHEVDRVAKQKQQSNGHTLSKKNIQPLCLQAVLDTLRSSTFSRQFFDIMTGVARGPGRGVGEDLTKS